jgi:hypothetical protein
MLPCGHDSTSTPTRSLRKSVTVIHSWLARGFCLPGTVALASPPWERILFFLAVALMESIGIRVLICAEPEYAEAGGFVLLPGNRAIIATWIHADGIWRAGTSLRPALLREVSGHVGAHSVTDALSPGHRLKALAGYLGLDWPWLGDRCLQLGRVGCGRLVRPGSRLLPSMGLMPRCASLETRPVKRLPAAR